VRLQNLSQSGIETFSLLQAFSQCRKKYLRRICRLYFTLHALSPQLIVLPSSTTQQSESVMSTKRYRTIAWAPGPFFVDLGLLHAEKHQLKALLVVQLRPLVASER
jgi:hypothetical protein